jgi:hypothetical protein
MCLSCGYSSDLPLIGVPVLQSVLETGLVEVSGIDCLRG